MNTNTKDTSLLPNHILFTESVDANGSFCIYVSYLILQVAHFIYLNLLPDVVCDVSLTGTVAEGAPIIPISAQLKYNIEVVCEYIVKKIPVPIRDFTSEPRLIGEMKRPFFYLSCSLCICLFYLRVISCFLSVKCSTSKFY